MSHSPAPWHLAGEHGYARIDDANGHTICGLGFLNEDEGILEDANLLCAAPDLLEACKTLLEADKMPFYEIAGHDSEGNPLNHSGVARNKIRAALSKATGKEPK